MGRLRAVILAQLCIKHSIGKLSTYTYNTYENTVSICVFALVLQERYEKEKINE